jgi:phthalate 4,5-cis-dihydrodiol dehydrogenase
MTGEALRVGIVGLGGAGMKMLAAMDGLRDLELTAAVETRAEGRAAFEEAFHRPCHPSVATMCRSAALDAVYIATPTALHCEHALEAIHAGKHVMCEKPLALRVEDCDRMAEAARSAGVLLMQGHSKLHEPRVRAMRSLLLGGRLGEVFQVDSWNFNDWMRRPRLASELDTETGGGVVLRQGPQHVDLARCLVGRTARSVRAVSGRRAPGLPTEGHYTALLTFEGGAAASLSFSGYGYLETADLALSPAGSRVPRPAAVGPVTAEEKYRAGRAGEGTSPLQPAARGQGGELLLVSCERGVVHQSPAGLYVHADGGREELAVPDGVGGAAGLLELGDAIRENRPASPDVAWAKGTLEICLAILESSRQDREILLEHQSGSRWS